VDDYPGRAAPSELTDERVEKQAAHPAAPRAWLDVEIHANAGGIAQRVPVSPLEPAIRVPDGPLALLAPTRRRYRREHDRFSARHLAPEP